MVASETQESALKNGVRNTPKKAKKQVSGRGIGTQESSMATLLARISGVIWESQNMVWYILKEGLLKSSVPKKAKIWALQ